MIRKVQSIITTAALLVIVLGMPVEDTRAQDRNLSEYQVKAAFLYNFARFVQWPDEVFERPSSPILVGILGPDPFGATIDAAFEGKAIGRHPFQVRRLRTIAEAANYHILFIANEESTRLRTVQSLLNGKPVLTVSEMPDFTANRGMIGFALDQSRVRFDVNVPAVQSAGLQISSRLLRVARNVTVEGATQR